MSEWNKQSLSIGMGAIFKAANESLASIKKEQAGLTAQVERLQALVTKATDDSALLSEMTQSAADSGIYHLTLAPEKGAWDNRILAATGIPPRDAAAFSVVIASIVSVADIGSATNIANTIGEAASAVIEAPKQFFSMPALPALTSVSIPSIPAPVPPPANEWKSATLGDLFPSLATEMAGAASSNAAKGEQANTALADIIAKQDELSTELNAAQKLVDDLESSNVSSFVAPPEATPTNDWYGRLTAANAAMPESNSAMFTSGTVTVIIAPDYTSLMTKFNNYSLKGL
jgi:hypothetical protein